MNVGDRKITTSRKLKSRLKILAGFFVVQVEDRLLGLDRRLRGRRHRSSLHALQIILKRYYLKLEPGFLLAFEAQQQCDSKTCEGKRMRNKDLVLNVHLLAGVRC